MAAEQEEDIEEVVVTGTYLKRSAADSPSPLSVMTSADIEDIGAADVAEVIASMPWNSGSQTRAATCQGEGADGRNTINLRNLGNASTCRWSMAGVTFPPGTMAEATLRQTSTP